MLTSLVFVELEPIERLTFAELAGRFLAAHTVGREPSTITTLRERLRRPVAAFGDVPLHDLEHRAMEIASWLATLPPGYRYAVMGAFRQVLETGVQWKLLSENPAKAAGRNPEPRPREVQTFRSDLEVDQLAVELGSVYGPALLIATETGLRPSEWIALEWRDVSTRDRVITINRTFAKGKLKDYGKTNRSRRSVPLTLRAVEAINALPRRLDSRLLFPSPGGGYVDLNNFRRREWAPALEAAGLPRYRIYDTRHRFASAALDAGISIFELSRLMGTGVRMIDRTYGHLVTGSLDRARDRLDARAAREQDEASRFGTERTPS